MIGSCTNVPFEDLSKAAALFREAKNAGLKPKGSILITAGSEKIRATVEREVIMQDFENAGATILSNSCGPFVGHWNRKEVVQVSYYLYGMLDIVLIDSSRVHQTLSFLPTIGTSSADIMVFPRHTCSSRLPGETIYDNCFGDETSNGWDRGAWNPRRWELWKS
jgi:hypothetical protein